jgi:hypothetical protein
MGTPDSNRLSATAAIMVFSAAPLGLAAEIKLGIRRALVDNNCYKYPVYLKIASVPAKRLVFRGLF